MQLGKFLTMMTSNWIAPFSPILAFKLPLPNCVFDFNRLLRSNSIFPLIGPSNYPFFLTTLPSHSLNSPLVPNWPLLLLFVFFQLHIFSIAPPPNCSSFPLLLLLMSMAFCISGVSVDCTKKKIFYLKDGEYP